MMPNCTGQKVVQVDTLGIIRHNVDYREVRFPFLRQSKILGPHAYRDNTWCSVHGNFQEEVVYLMLYSGRRDGDILTTQVDGVLGVGVFALTSSSPLPLPRLAHHCTRYTKYTTVQRPT